MRFNSLGGSIFLYRFKNKLLLFGEQSVILVRIIDFIASSKSTLVLLLKQYSSNLKVIKLINPNKNIIIKALKPELFYIFSYEYFNFRYQILNRFHLD